MCSLTLTLHKIFAVVSSAFILSFIYAWSCCCLNRSGVVSVVDASNIYGVIKCFPHWSFFSVTTLTLWSIFFLQVVLLGLYTACPWLHDQSKPFLWCIVWNCVNASLDFAWIMLISLNHFPLNTHLSFGKREKSSDAKSDESGRCWKTMKLLLKVLTHVSSPAPWASVAQVW